jgi:hypothetical protein
MGGEEITSGDIIVKHPGESADFECLEDGVVMVVKVPCAK